MSYSNLTPETISGLVEICAKLVFFHHSLDPEGLCWKVMFGNGYGASIVKGSLSYGRLDDLWELAVLKKSSDGSWDLCFDTPVASDEPLGWLEECELLPLVKKIADF